MKVTDLNYALEKPKIAVLDWLCERVTKRNFQNVIITDGMEGYGKSTLTAGDAYYVAHKTKRKLSLFFDLKALNKYSKEVKDEVIIWDDAALSALSIEAYNATIIELIKILLLARKKRNTYFINIQEVFRLKEPLVGRACAFNHVYSPDGLTLGKYVYMNEVQLKFTYHLWKTRKRKQYKYYSFRGSFPNVLTDIFDEEQYEALKDKAIESIGKKDKTQIIQPQYLTLIHRLKKNIIDLDLPVKEKVKIGDFDQRHYYKWKKEVLESLALYDTVSNANVQTPITNDNGGYIRPKDESYLTATVDKKTGLITNSPLLVNKNKTFIYHGPPIKIGGNNGDKQPTEQPASP